MTGATAAFEVAMRVALDEAAVGAAAGEIPIGAVVLTGDGTVLSRAHN